MQRVRYDASPDVTSRMIMYQARMKYLKSREGGKRPQARNTMRRQSSLDLFDLGEGDEVEFSVLKVKGPCTPEILEPPPELMTRSRSFRQAFWKHHINDSKKEVEKLELVHVDEQKERLNNKRKDILAKLRSKEKAKREADIRRRADRVLNRNSSSGIESEEEEEESELEGQLGMMSLSPSRDSDTAANSSPGRRKIMASLAVMPNRRTLGGSPEPEKDELKVEDDSEADDSFSFLSEWSSTPQKKIRW